MIISKASVVVDANKLNQLLIEVDARPTGIIYNVKRIGSSDYIFGEKDGYVSYRIHDSNNETGSYGDVETYMTKDGERSFKGCWSSRAGVFNKMGYVQSMNVLMKVGMSTYSSSITVQIATKLVADAGYRLVRCVKNGDVNYEIVKEGDAHVLVGEGLTVKYWHINGWHVVVETTDKGTVYGTTMHVDDARAEWKAHRANGLRKKS